jgi:NADPH-dependent 7-cyano-7-deazaguanine reductase QueF-like protein
MKAIKNEQVKLFEDKIEFEHVTSVIGSGYEQPVANLAVRDGVAYRAARKNMQIHSAIILKINDEFSGFFTFQVNHEAKEFCLLQSAMELNKKDADIYKKMVFEIIKQNTYGYPMIMTVSTKHDLECPKVFESIGFKTYLNLSGYEYMVYGTFDQVRMKRLAHATMTNAWTTTRADWLKMKKEWNDRIEQAGEKYNIPNPKFASRDGCWQGSNGYSNVVLSKQVIVNGEVEHEKGKSFNGNASVLDPVACEVILRFFMPTEGRRIYNPFGGGVQFGFVSGFYGYEYIASEIRQNQCDANNIICQDFESVKWIKSDSSTYEPEGEFDLCFTCPPYYKVEKYIDYDGVIPDGELNDLKTYDEFRETLFAGYKKAISSLKENRFFVVMTGDSRDKNGAYYGCEAEHELFFKEQGLHIYNKIVYLECEFTRLAHAKRTLDYRKFPKREQKILVFFKGDMKKIKETFPPIGRL